VNLIQPCITSLYQIYKKWGRKGKGESEKDLKKDKKIQDIIYAQKR